MCGCLEEGGIDFLNQILHIVFTEFLPCEKEEKIEQKAWFLPHREIKYSRKAESYAWSLIPVATNYGTLSCNFLSCICEWQ